MTLRAVHHVAISVRNLERSLAFYLDALGLEVYASGTLRGGAIARLVGLPPEVEARQVFVGGPDNVGQVELVEWDPPSAPTSRGITDLGLSLVSFGTSSDAFDEIVSRCRRDGTPIVGGPELLESDDYPPTRLVLLEDPDGNVVEIMAAATPQDVAAARRSAAGSD